MSKNDEITEEERDEFRKKVGNIKELSNNDKVEPSVVKKPPQLVTQPLESESIDFALSEYTDWHDAQDCLHFARPGIQHRLLSKMKRGQLSIQSTLDLHQMNRMEAATALHSFITQAQDNHLKVVLIIHGKSHDKPVLKNLAKQFLQQDQRVLAFHSATPQDGGTGALYVLIKSNKALG